jgi:UDP-N-acetylglucosamine acyltransferase
MLMGGHVKIDDWAGISGYVGLHHFLTVGRHAYVGGYTRANVDIPPFMIVTGIPMTVVAPNFVGLKRRGFQDESIMALKDAHRLIWRSGLPKSESITLVEQRYPKQAEVRVLLDFLHATDKGKLGRARDTGANGHGEGDEVATDA